MRHTQTFRRAIEDEQILVLPGAHDALSAKIIAQTGFRAFTAGGYSATASLLGAPDTSQLSLSELADHYMRLADASDLPFLADGDTGFGNTTNVTRTVRRLERAGVAALFIEDQVFPKRCGHMTGKAVVQPVEMVEKLKAALDARVDDEMMIMARTDALAVNGIDDAIARAQLYVDAGADLIFVEAPVSIEQMRRICSEVDAPCLANNIEGGKTPFLDAGELQEIGYAAVVYPVSATYAITHALHQLMSALHAEGTTRDSVPMVDFTTFNDLIGLPELRARERDFQFAARTLVESR